MYPVYHGIGIYAELKLLGMWVDVGGMPSCRNETEVKLLEMWDYVANLPWCKNACGGETIGN